MEKIAYRGWKTCWRLSNGLVELVITGDVGPRIIRFGLVGGQNEFKEYDSMLGATGGDEWRIYGGHRLWHAPEAKPRTYHPDNAPVKVEEKGAIVRVVQPRESTTGIEKELDIRLDPKEPHVEVIHRLRNANLWAVELAPWALSVMAPGGKVVIPLPPRGSHEENLLPTNTITLWAYTDMSDRRWTWGTKYVMLEQDPRARSPQKIGLAVPAGWAAYANGGRLFVKRFAYVQGANYPDFGCSVETFTNADMIELETLGPLARLEPGAAVEHVEHWHLFKDVPVPAGDADVERHILPRVASVRT